MSEEEAKEEKESAFEVPAKPQCNLSRAAAAAVEDKNETDCTHTHTHSHNTTGEHMRRMQ